MKNIDEIAMLLWLPLLVTIVGGLVLWYLKGIIQHFRRTAKEKRVFKFLKSNTMDKAGQQFLSINFVSTKLNIGEHALLDIVNDSSRIFFCPSNKDSIGICATERSIYEERGVIVM
jgi:lipopolysaccharide/colanic/teichoic acid biosynthesis glycosyltransferase